MKHWKRTIAAEPAGLEEKLLADIYLEEKYEIRQK